MEIFGLICWYLFGMFLYSIGLDTALAIFLPLVILVVVAFILSFL